MRKEVDSPYGSVFAASEHHVVGNGHQAIDRVGVSGVLVAVIAITVL